MILKTGDVVMNVKTDVLMTVESVSKSRKTTVCVWFEGTDLKRRRFNASSVEFVR